MNEITGQVFSVAKENRPVAGCTISKEVFSNGEDYILYFSLAKDTDISAEIYDYQKLIIVSDGNMEVYTNKDVWKLNSSDCILTPASIPVGMRTNTKAVYTEVSIRRSNINNAVNPGEVFKLADLLPYQDGKIVNMDIAHNDKMKARLETIGVDGAKIVSVGVMDYLRDDPLDEDSCRKRITKDGPVVLASNLAPHKSVFAYHLPDCLHIDLYGPDYTGPVNDMVQYRGVYDPVELMDVMEGSFGLVWDSTSADTCDGPFGEYMLFNNPHKIALYLASGMPVIVWDRSAMADFVKEEGCGFMVSRLSEIPDKISELSDEDYEKMRNNAMRVGKDMRKGSHIKAAVERAVELSEIR